MDQEKFLEARIDYAITYNAALDRVLGWTDTECRLILFGLLMGFPMSQNLNEIYARRKLSPPDLENEITPEAV